MGRDTLEQICLWTLTMCVGTAVAFMLGGMAPSFILAFGLFGTAHHSVRRSLIDCDRNCSDAHLERVRFAETGLLVARRPAPHGGYGRTYEGVG